MKNSWNLLRLNAQLQARFCEHMAEYYPEVKLYFPTFVHISRPAKRRQPIRETRPVYPGYIFSQTDSHFQSPHRFHYVRFGGSIAHVPDRVIQELQRLESINALVTIRSHRDPYTPGTRILVHTPNYDIRAIIVQLSKNQVIAETPIGTISVPFHKITLI